MATDSSDSEDELISNTVRAPVLAPRSLKRKSSCSAAHALVLKQFKWAYIYEIVDEAGRPIYVGQTTNETQRAAAHQRSATSQCKRLASAIENLRLTCPTWTFSKSFRRVVGLLNGVPPEHADKYEGFFISRIGGHGTLHNEMHNPRGCNQREGNHVLKYEKEFPEIQRRLHALDGGHSLFSAEDRRRRLSGVSREMVDSAAELQIVSAVRDALAEDGYKLECVEQAYQLVGNRHTATSNADETRVAIKSVKALFAKATAVDEKEVDRCNFAKQMNHIKGLLCDFLPSDTNLHQQMAQRLALVNLKHISHFFFNGEEAGEHATPTPCMALDAVRVLEMFVKMRDNAVGVPGQSFQSRLAWCKPHSQLKGDLKDNLNRVDVLLTEPLTDEQRARGVERRREIVEEMRVLALAQAHHSRMDHELNKN